MKKALFLYTELADYFVNCITELHNHGVEIHLIKWPIKNEAPFKFVFPEDVMIYERSDFDRTKLFSLVNEIEPDLIFSSGWMDKDYVAVCRKFYGKIPTVTGMDNQWTGAIKQQVARFLSPFSLQRTFSHVWVPGKPQEDYARKLDYKDDQILKGFYSANTKKFNSYYRNNLDQKKSEFPRKFLYVGRYVEFKGIYDLWQAFTELQEEQENDWELWCLGTGSEWEQRTLHPQIKHFGFVQPSEMEQFIQETGVFILPSHREPWGVVVHEMAAAGFPLICSDKIGAATAFLKENKNGFSFEAGKKESLKYKMKRIMLMPESELLEMAESSHQLGQQISPEKWVAEISKLLKN